MNEQYKKINQVINDTMKLAHRSDKIKLLAVSKKQALEKVIALHKLGQNDFGESYVQEAKEKILALEQYNLNWHFIGPIQSNKTKIIANLFDWVHSVDRLKIAKRLDQQRDKDKKPINICLQININNEETKSGFSSSEIEHAIAQVLKFNSLHLRGLMAIPEKSDSMIRQRQNFALLRRLLEQLNHKFSLTMDTLSMGMSNDMQAAILEGATIVRVGTALFGQRL